jgi:hypothetical protein
MQLHQVKQKYYHYQVFNLVNTARTAIRELWFLMSWSAFARAAFGVAWKSMKFVVGLGSGVWIPTRGYVGGVQAWMGRFQN